MSHPRSRRWPLVLAGALVLPLVACSGGSDDTAKAGSDEFPADQFPPSTYEDLEGRLTFYDVSGGAFTEAMDDTINKDFAALSGVEVTNDYNADMTKFVAAMQAGQGTWDVVEFPTKADALQAQEEGYLAEIDTDVVPVDQLEPGNAEPWAYSVHRYATVLAWNTDSFDGESAPTEMSDLFDTQRFPGKRCLFGYPAYAATLESALIADGVAQEDLYPLDVERALDKLDTIKKDIVWWESPDQSIQYLTSGECDLALTYNGRLFDAVTKDDSPLDFTWEGSMYAAAWYAIPSNAPNPKAAQAYLAHAIQNTEAQTRFLEEIPYPSPIKGLEVPDSVDNYVPLGDNVEGAFAQDDEWYQENLGDVSERFTAWLGS